MPTIIMKTYGYIRNKESVSKASLAISNNHLKDMIPTINSNPRVNHAWSKNPIGYVCKLKCILLEDFGGFFELSSKGTYIDGIQEFTVFPWNVCK